MSRIMEILILIGTFVSVIYILLRIHKLKIKMEDTVFWICFAVLIAVLGTIPEVASRMATLLGIQSPVNLVFLVIIGLLIEKLFTVSVTLSMLEEKVTILSAELAIRSRDAAEGRKELGEELSEAEKKIDMTKSNEDIVSE